MRLLMVDDDFDKLIEFGAAKETLEKFGFEIEIVRTGEEAVLIIRKEPGAYRAIFLDIEFEGRMEGSRYLDMIRHVDANTPIIMISGGEFGNRLLSRKMKKGVRLAQGYINKGDWAKKSKQSKIIKIMNMIIRG